MRQLMKRPLIDIETKLRRRSPLAPLIRFEVDARK